ncbi:MAG: hypothetical protein EXR33_05370 [Betaproteobacteria bacterium]|nr:hypothetical protein [Betaproteobacteria bacterium]
MLRRAACVLLVIGVALFPLRAALAQSYPSKVIRLVSPFPPGGSVDVVGRLLAARLSEALGQQIVVDNRSGASGVIGTEIVMNSPPDGYTLLINTIPFVSNQFLMPRAPYDPLRDFVSISIVASAPSFVTVHPSVPARSVQELVALAKAKSGALNYAAAGVGTNPHIAGELFNLLADVNIVAVQYKGGGPADMAVIAGEVGITFDNISQELGFVKAGRMRALAVMSAKRNPAIPELPTVAEAVGEKLRAAAAPSGPGGILTLALAALDIAMWDIKGKALGVPVATLSGGYRREAPTYASDALMRQFALEHVVRAGPRLVEKGFRQMKMQLALPGDTSPGCEVERTRLIRESIGEGIDLMCDINQR